jgi:hypothetical protein
VTEIVTSPFTGYREGGVCYFLRNRGYLSTKLRGVIFQEIATWILIALSTSNLIFRKLKWDRRDMQHA